MKGDVEAIDRLVHSHDDTQVRFLGVTPLLIATIAGQRLAVERLLEKGADMKERDDDSRTIFKLALDSQHTSLAQYLVEKRPHDIPVTDPRLPEGKTWLRDQFDDISEKVDDNDSKPPEHVLNYLLEWKLPPHDDGKRPILV